MEIDFASDLKEIFDRYEEEKQKPLKGNDLANKMGNEFNDHFKEFVKEFISDEYEYICKISSGQGKWVNKPWADVRYPILSNSFKDGFYFYSHFNLTDKVYDVGLIQGKDDVDSSIGIARAKFIKEKIQEKYPEKFNDIIFADKIIIKTINYDDLTNENLKLAYKETFEIYESLIPDVLDFIKNEPPKEEDIRPEDDGIRIWRVAPGNKEVLNEGWEEFKQGSYVGIGFQYEENDVNYSEFKNKWALDKYLDNFGVKSPSKSMLWKFVNWVRKGDIVVVNKGRSKFAGLGIVSGDFIPATENKNKNDFGLNSIYPVDWIITPDDLEVNENFFVRHTLIEWGGEKWNQLLCIFARNDEELRERILENIYDESYKLLIEDHDNHHLTVYRKEKEEITAVWNDILTKYNNNEPIHEDVWNKLLNRENKVHLDAVKDVKSALKAQLNHSDEDMEKTANLLFETLLKLKDNGDIEDQKRIMKEYAESEYSKGFKSGRFSSILYYLDNNYFVINKKTIDSVKLLSLMLGDEIILNAELEDYIDNNIKYHDFLEKLKNTYYYDKLDISDFVIFDAICHYLCSKTSINYIGKDAEIIPLEFIVDEGTRTDPPLPYDPLNLTPDIIYAKLQPLEIAGNIINQLCASLNAGKNIILDGTPGTGKTELAKKFATAASDKNFIDGYVLTTATSDWTTFDTIGGLMPNEKGELFFYPGKFLDSIAENKWLIIDEINRADIDKAFGQLFTVLSKQDVELPYKENGKSIKIKIWDENYSKYDSENAIYFIGNNWRIIGTMNVDDKDSLFDLSYAFMRRFMFIEVDIPEKDRYMHLIEKWSNGLSNYCTKKLKILYDLNIYRKIGPAIFKDMAEYIKFREKIIPNINLRDEELNIIEEAIASYIIPQFEGLNKSKIQAIIEIFENNGFSKDLIMKLEELIPKY
ncbi:MAG: DUF3578 domain-containing protein [Methanobrevibacter ruminantium]|uniref:MrcB family domain-containing protein n=1 Tax=Methanobrevibacter ruminantium TaxID=83816 RepID=UPI0026F2E312|nr:DUF3578 domain-containing protein [Methanobrevibacter ruminantium]MDD6049280.1 DUF3578 domain-containing protein [Methanobrevibacter ruminantium]